MVLIKNEGDVVIDNEFDKIFNEVVEALTEKGYCPFEQITGYLEMGSDTYITRHGDAREKIKHLDKDQLRKKLAELSEEVRLQEKKECQK